MQLLLDEQYIGMVKRVIDLARDHIFVSQFKIDSAGIIGKSAVSDLLNLLVKRKDEGIRVQVLLDCIEPLRGRAANNAAVALWLKKKGIGVRFLDRNRCLHSKILIVDGVHSIVGSHNWTRNSLLRNNECSMYATDAEIAGRLEQFFVCNYEGARDFTEKHSVGFRAGFSY